MTAGATPRHAAHYARSAARGPVLAGALAMVSMALAGCASIPGMAVDLKDDNPQKTWTEARTREVYGAPVWSAALPDGGKALYFEYKTVPSSRTLAIATAITTFGTVRNGGSLEFKLVTIIGPDGTLVCADRARIVHALMTCPHERRLNALEALPDAQSATYRRLLIELEPRQYAIGHFYLAAEPVLTPEQIAAAHATGVKTGSVTDDRPYYFAAECSVLMGWYERHLEVLKKDSAPAARLAAPYATALYAAAGARGMPPAEAARDVETISRFWQQQLDKGELSYPTRAAAPCLTRTPGKTWSPNTLQRFDSGYYDQAVELVQLAQAMALVEHPETPENTDRTWSLIDAPGQYYPIGYTDGSGAKTGHFSRMPRHSEQWLASVGTERAALAGSVSIDALAMPLPVMEQVFVELNAAGKTPGRQVHLRLRTTLEAQLAISNLSGALRTVATLGRYYLAQPPSNDTLTKAGDLLTSAAWIADRIGEHRTAASLATVAADAYLAGIQETLNEYGLGDAESRSVRREILNFVPYEYERSNWDGTSTIYRVEATPIDAKGMLDMISNIARQYPNVVHQMSFAVPHYLEPRTAAVYFDGMANSASLIFSSKGAYEFRMKAAEAYALAGDEQLAAIARMLGEIDNVRARSRDPKSSRERNCEINYKRERSAFAERFGDPTYRDVKKLFGSGLADSLKEIDRRCKYGKTGLFGALSRASLNQARIQNS